jgi:mono/diheme cytochrome c family protein
LPFFGLALGTATLGVMACGGADERDTDRTSLAARATNSVMYYDTMAIARPAAAATGAAVNGAEVYNSCAACHQPNGQGMPGSWPPLAGSEWLLNNPEVPIRIVLHGLHGPITVKGQSYNNVMQAWGETFSDEQIAAVLTYARSNWGNNAPAITAEQVAAVREATKDRTEMWTAEELQGLLEAK